MSIVSEQLADFVTTTVPCSKLSILSDEQADVNTEEAAIPSIVRSDTNAEQEVSEIVCLADQNDESDVNTEEATIPSTVRSDTNVEQEVSEIVCLADQNDESGVNTEEATIPSTVRSDTNVEQEVSEIACPADQNDEFGVNTEEATIPSIVRSGTNVEQEVSEIACPADQNDQSDANIEEVAIPLIVRSDTNVEQEVSEIACPADQNDAHVTQETSSSNSGGMNSAFLASESEYVSFNSQGNNSLPQNSSGDQGYYTPPYQPASLEIIKEQDNNEVDPNSSDNQTEALCSSRIEDDTEAMPYPDVSPVNGEDEIITDKDVSVNFRSLANDFERPTLEERVPHLHYVPSKTEADQKKSVVIVPEVTKKTLENSYTETADKICNDEELAVEEDKVDKTPLIENLAIKESKKEKDDIIVTQPSADLVNPQTEVDHINDELTEEEHSVGKKKGNSRVLRRRLLDYCNLL